MPRRKTKIDGVELLNFLLSRTQLSPTSCREWLGPIQENGYVKIWYSGTHRWAHRVVYELATGVSPGDLHVLHKCDNPKCINPNHLEIGTRSDNMLDCAIKGRWHTEARTSAMRVSRAKKLSPSYVMAIRTKEQNGESVKSIAKEFGIDCSMVRMIANLKTWVDLP
ncbi:MULTISPECIES: HNH endonuclease [Burkholderia]|uniref:HNH endonuclease n=1 Tax=Burkholderia pyrrocinia TaxID=60550 RepID=A0A318IY18_BURPY|nr:HNH endonuclease [Burkholderia pyrrocinia]SFW58509.1 HNH endonuclease [Burkholderia sp. NFACC33-1]SFY12011.1 HNH endonuclease [Burkholderia sp. NFPP32]